MTIQSLKPVSVIQWGRAGICYALEYSVEYLVLLGLILCVYASNNFSSTFTVTLFLFPLIFGLGCITAKGADTKVSVHTLIKHIPIEAFGKLLLLGLVPWIAFVILGKLFDSLFYKASVLFFMDQSIKNVSVLHSMNIDLLLWFFICGSFFWFVVPLIAMKNHTLVDSFSMAWSALKQNNFVLTMNFVFALVLTLTLLAPVLIAPFFAITSAMMYVSYKQIYPE